MNYRRFDWPKLMTFHTPKLLNKYQKWNDSWNVLGKLISITKISSNLAKLILNVVLCYFGFCVEALLLECPLNVPYGERDDLFIDFCLHKATCRKVCGRSAKKHPQLGMESCLFCSLTFGSNSMHNVRKFLVRGYT